MLAEGAAAVAGAFSVAVVQAVASDTWIAFRDRAAQIIGRGERTDVSVELDRLDRTAAVLTSAEPDERERVGLRQEGAWQDRVEDLLRGLPVEQRATVVAELNALVEERQALAADDRPAGDVYHGPTAVQRGNFNQQTNHFGPGA
ncbi:hypothetical protein [Streptomyces sp. NPDC006368]|uniref:hypothetical protein n=1 Tax=Streptomyces sp. NPDC006368 TaxID=3156760 RepID=UPI0033B37192